MFIVSVYTVSFVGRPVSTLHCYKFPVQLQCFYGQLTTFGDGTRDHPGISITRDKTEGTFAVSPRISTMIVSRVVIRHARHIIPAQTFHPVLRDICFAIVVTSSASVTEVVCYDRTCLC